MAFPSGKYLIRNKDFSEANRLGRPVKAGDGYQTQVMDVIGYVIAYGLAALVVGGYFYVQRLKARGKKPAPGDLGATLQLLNGKIEKFAGTTIHPRELKGSPDFAKAVELLGKCDIDLLRHYATAANPNIAAAAFEALSKHPKRQEAFDAVIVHINQFTPEAMHYALRYFSSLERRPPVGGPAVIAQGWWANNVSLSESFKDYFGQRRALGDAPDFGAYLEWNACQPHAAIKSFLERVNDETAKSLIALLAESRSLNRKFLDSFGRFGSQPTPEDIAIELKPWMANLDLAEKSVLADKPRSVLVSGESRTGKTSFLKLLGRRLARQGWSVFEAGAADLMAGQTYFGELEGRVRQTVAELEASKRVAWSIGDILQFAESGTHRGQSSSLLDQILPAILDGRLVILAETSPQGLIRLMHTHPSLRTQLEIYKLQPLAEEDVAYLAREAGWHLASRSGIMMQEDAIEAALQLAQQYLGGSQPGLVVDLLKRAVRLGVAAKQTRVTPHSVLTALSQITGLPIAMLDDKERVDLDKVRRFLSDHVMGQEEAVSAIVDRIAMLKAGLADPKRPVGVFLFAGPTGTGKTELAKTLAAYLFGSAERMTRLDMSEFQAPDSIAKIVGERGFSSASDPLVERVRKQPFCVILLDEFEKAHPNVWDLFLQIFDDGRLADANGRVADFRHSIIILTSNLGATDHQAGAIGFARVKDSYGESQVLKAVARTFRPEFVNRLDKIVVFKPLSRSLMREILEKELRAVLERRGLRNRDWAVEWEPSALEFLLDKGFSPEMGARPLKRAIDQYLLAPLAATLVEGHYPKGDQFLFVRSNGKALEIEFVDPDAELPAPLPAAPSGKEESLGGMILEPRGSEEERAALDTAFARLETELAGADWNGAKQEAEAEAGSEDIWSNPRRHAIFARLAAFDRVREAFATAERLKQRLARYLSRELIQRLALQLHLVTAGMEDVEAGAPVDAVIAIEPVLEKGAEQGATLSWCARLDGMYKGWAQLRHMQLLDMAGGEASLIAVAGFGAFRALMPEAGLHVLEDGKQRLTARVIVTPGPEQEPRPAEARRVYERLIAASEKSTTVVRRYRQSPSPLVRDAGAGWRTGRLDLVLAGNFDLMASVLAED